MGTEEGGAGGAGWRGAWWGPLAPPDKGWWDRSQPAVREVGSTEAQPVQSVMEMLGHSPGSPCRCWEVLEPSWGSYEEGRLRKPEPSEGAGAGHRADRGWWETREGRQGHFGVEEWLRSPF